MATKEHLKLEERVKIQSLIDSRYCRNLSRLAEEIGCDRSTIYREIKNNSYVKNGAIEYYKHDSNHVECGIAGDVSLIQNMDDDILLEEETYYIRKKKFTLHYGIYIN